MVHGSFRINPIYTTQCFLATLYTPSIKFYTYTKATSLHKHKTHLFSTYLFAGYLLLKVRILSTNYLIHLLFIFSWNNKKKI